MVIKDSSDRSNTSVPLKGSEAPAGLWAGTWQGSDAWFMHDSLRELTETRRELLGAGRDILDLTMLNPDIPPPRFLVDKLLEASLRPLNHRYAVSRGIRKLREGFVDKYASAFGAALNPETEVVATLGTKDALFHGVPLLARPGDAVLVGVPCYPAFTAALRLAGARAIPFRLDTEERMLEQIGELLAVHRPKLVLLNFPNNPTGQVVGADFYRRLAALLDHTDATVLNDFVYGEMGFQNWSDGTALPHAPVSVLSIPELRMRAVEIYSLSKAYSVPGWRVGAMLGKADIVARLSQLKAHIDYGLFLPLQLAAAAALSARLEIRTTIVRTYEERVRFLSKGLKRIGWAVSTAGAGASVWARIPDSCVIPQGVGSDSLRYARQLLRENGIAALPGHVYGQEFSRYVRFACVVPTDILREVLGRLEGLHSRSEAICAEIR